MTVIALDTSHNIGSVTLVRDGVIAGTEYFGADASHLAELTACTDRLLADHGLTVADVVRVAFVSGPGSFTGLRIGCAFAKGIHAATDTDIVVMDTLSLLIAPHFADNTVCAMIDARRGEVYASARATSGTVLSPRVADSERVCADLPDAVDVFVGTGALLYRALIQERYPGSSVLGEHDALPSTAFLALAAEGMKPLSREAVVEFEPWYIRPSDAQLKRLKSIADDVGTDSKI